uniref:alpha/beta hydrolase family protein n=1 Tax=uncultured Erythrobacter sp. TaxID=263913 RepID=UPI00262A07FA|nr:S9 family peptidase [uncultured Erythrobacter sp.]
MNLFGKAISAAALVASSVFVVSVPANAQQESAEELAARFGARPNVLDISISPSGDKVAYITSDNATTELLYVVDLTGDAEPLLLTSANEANAELSSCNWANDVWLVCNIVGITRVDGQIPIYVNRLVSVATDGSEPNLLTSRTSTRASGVQQDGGSVLSLDVQGEKNRILVTRQFLEETATNSRLGNADSGLGVEMIDVTRNRRKTVEKPDEAASRYVADENGVIRVKVRRLSNGAGRLTGETRYSYRQPGSREWQPFGDALKGFVPVAVDAGDNVAYGYKSKDGFDAVYRVPLDGSGAAEVVASRSDVDVDGLIRIGRKQRVVGATFATEKRQVEYFDPELAKLARGLQNALPGKPLIDIIDASADENTLLIVASSDVDPGMTYLLERDTRALSPLLPLRDPLAERAMAPMKPVTFPAQDGTEIPGYLTLPLNAEGPVAAIVLPHGGPGARDYWGFDWMVQFFAARGYAVLQPNFRGSTGYGDAWFGRNGFKAWETAIGDVNDAGRWLVSEGIADPDRLGIAGWSYGGYAALQSQVLDADLYKAVVAIAPVTDLQLTIEEARDYTNFNVVRRFIGDGPHVKAGSPANFAAQFKAPVLMFHGTEDMNVGHLQSRRMEDRLKDAGRSVRYVEYEGFDHYLDHGQVRGNMLKAIDEFLAENLGE